MGYTIKEVTTRRDLKRFVRFPDLLYKDCRQYVPALHSDQFNTLTKSASLKYCTRKMWLALDGKKVVGRICGMINPRYNELYGKKRARFGWFDTIEDIEVARLLLDTAQAWAKSQGMEEIHGPLYYNTLGKQGMLVEGFENIPPFNCIYNFPYYKDFVEKLGFVKECDWLQHKIHVGSPLPDKAYRVANIVKQRYNIRIGSIDKLKKDPERVKAFFRIYNDSFASSVYNFIPFTEEEMEEEAKQSMPFISDKSCVILLDEDDEIAAFGITFPTISPALQKAKGHMFPFGWIHFLKAMKDFETTDLMVHGAAPKWQNKGISAVYYTEMNEKAAKLGMKWAITNPAIETNSAVNIWNDYDHEPFMRRRCYIKEID